jgi:hypothetical protein
MSVLELVRQKKQKELRLKAAQMLALQQGQKSICRV